MERTLSLNFNPLPVLTTERVVLRKLSTDDTPEFFALRTDDRVLQFTGRPKMKSPDAAREFIIARNADIDKNIAPLWAMELKETGKLIGTACIWNISTAHFRADIGYELMPDYHGRGLMNEAVIAVLDFGFNTIGLHTIVGNVSPGNTASIRLLERNGFVKEAHFREDFFYNGKFLDTAVYSLINPAERS